MGNKASTTKTKDINLEGLLRTAMKLAYIAIADLYEYREEIKPAIDKITNNKEKMLTIKVDRNRIYEEATGRFVGKVKQLDDSGSLMHEKPVIEFKDTDELDVDGSGFRREYYAVYFRKCITNMFEGNGRRMLPRKDCTKKDELRALGIAIVECILNGDCGFPYLHPAVYKTIIGCDSDEVDRYLSIDDIPDGEVRMITEQIRDATTEDELSQLVASDDATFLNYIGWPPGQKITMSNRDVLLQYITRWFIIDHRHNEIEQLRHGLSYMGFLDTIKSKAWFEPLFVYSEQYSITAKYMKDKLMSVLDKLETKNNQEKRSKEFAVKCIDSIDDKQARLLFAFITNLYDPPIEEESLEVRFNRRNPDRILPESYTCLNILILPLGNKDLDSFKDSFLKAIMEQSSLL